MDNPPKKLAFLVTELGYFCSHRLNLAMAAKKAGYHVSVIANCAQRSSLSRYESDLAQLDLHHIPFHRSRLNPFAEIGTLRQIWRVYRRIRPDIVHQVAFKPLVYGTVCARLLKVGKIVNALGGMGYLFTHQSLTSRVLKPLLSLSFRALLNGHQCALILQNQDDAALMASFVVRDKIHLIKGAGIDLEVFHPTDEPPLPVKAVMASRLLWSKGIGELVEAAQILKRQAVPLEIQVAGEPDPQNPASVPPDLFQKWKEEGMITWLGSCTDMAAVYGQTHIAVLPSYYREGIPKALLEAAACGKPIVTTDAPGCRDVVTSGENGFLIPPKDPAALADALKKLALSSDLREKMGQMSRKKAEEEFGDKKIIEQTMALYK
jgi:glycosyltransferase involved in cell wall biosynthesis